MNIKYVCLLSLLCLSCGSSDQTAKKDTTAATTTNTKLTYASVQSILSQNCVSCHNASTMLGGVQLDTLAGVKTYAATAKADIDSGRMPKGTSFTSAQDKSDLSNYLANGTDLK